MFKMNFVVTLLAVIVVVQSTNLRIVGIDESAVCTIKRSCMDCLRLPVCSWCETEKKCFSKTLEGSQEFCANDTLDHNDYGFSLEENAECSCARGVMDRSCYPGGVVEGLECSGRGTCVCGRCICNTLPDPEHPTKSVMGEYCEFDNFSCDGPKCNEGPYSQNELAQVQEENSSSAPDMDY